MSVSQSSKISEGGHTQAAVVFKYIYIYMCVCVCVDMIRTQLRGEKESLVLARMDRTLPV